jgi:predicted DNA-binding transcriptional regulator AlpA
MRIDTDKLLTVRNFAAEIGISRQRLYKVIDAGRISIIEIDGIKFVHKNKLSKGIDK